VKKLFLSLPLALGLGIPSFAQDLALRVHVVAATVQDSPVRVVQLILWPNPPDSRSSITIGVVVHNFSDKRVVSTRVEYWVGGLAAALPKRQVLAAAPSALNPCISSLAQKVGFGPLLVPNSQSVPASG
jgi:hypothetical protein